MNKKSKPAEMDNEYVKAKPSKYPAKTNLSCIFLVMLYFEALQICCAMSLAVPVLCPDGHDASYKYGFCA